MLRILLPGVVQSTLNSMVWKVETPTVIVAAADTGEELWS